MKQLLFIACMYLLFSCNNKVTTKLKPGDYRAVLKVQDTKELPFNFKVVNDSLLQIYNGEEMIPVDEITYYKDSIKINFQVYEGYIAGTFVNGEITNANYIKESLDRVVPVAFTNNESQRFLNVKTPTQDVSGIWEMTFTEDNGSTFTGKGIFNQVNKTVTGTIRTATGDYRYLEGVMDGNMLKLSVFDGAHAFLFTATVNNDVVSKGTFYSGNHYKAEFVAKKNPEFTLPNEESLTFLKEGYDTLEFSFPDLDGNIISLTDEQFQDEVVVVQIMGSWCPNCLDESKYYAEYFKNNPNKDLEFIALAFEYAKTPEKALKSLKRLKDRIGIEYPILLAQYGTSDKKQAQEKLPMLNHVLSYPTTIFIDKKGQVRKIHTGFNGPATGDKYITFKKDFESFVTTLLAE